MYYIKLDNRLDLTIEQIIEIDKYVSDLDISYFFKKYNIKKSKTFEKAISKNPDWSFFYAMNIIKDEFKEAEEAIAESHYYSYFYAKYVIKDRFLIGETTIKNSEYRQSYEKLFGIKL